MSTKKARETFKEILNLCYNEDYPELHKELISLESETKKSKESYKYEKAIENVLSAIGLFTDDFPDDIYSEIEQIYEEYKEEYGE
jgi:hypothetical protein